MSNANATAKKTVSNCMDHTLNQLAKKEQEELFYDITPADLLVIDSCPMCHSKETTRISEVYLKGEFLFFATETCNDCLHVWRSVSPNRLWFLERWKQISTKSLEVFNPVLEEARGERYEKYLSKVQEYIKDGCVLDIGAAYGTGASKFLQAGYDVEVVEPEDDRAHYIENKLGIKVHASGLEDVSPSRSYDAIIFAHCLEHLDEPVEMTKVVRDWLNKEKGIIYLEIPLLWNIVDWRDAFFMAHKSNFTQAGACKLMEDSGMRVHETFMVPDSEADFDNLGMVLSCSDSYQEKPRDNVDKKAATVEDVVALYHKELPFKADTSKPLKYSVPYINHFYYIVRIQQGEFIDRRDETGFIEFERNQA